MIATAWGDGGNDKFGVDFFVYLLIFNVEGSFDVSPDFSVTTQNVVVSQQHRVSR